MWSLVCLEALQMSEAKQKRRAGPLTTVSGKFLVPYMWHGPNNQINAIKETLAVALLLNRTVAIPDLHTHLFTDKESQPMPFEDLFDFQQLKRGMDVVLLRQVKESWGNQLTAAALFVPRDVAMVRGVGGGRGGGGPGGARDVR